MIAAVAAAVLIAATAILVTGDWSVECRLDGARETGIDCFQTNAMPESGSAPARWVGFAPLAAAWLVAITTLAVCLLRLVRRSARGHARGAGPSRAT